jgi:hypothetical protein
MGLNWIVFLTVYKVSKIMNSWILLDESVSREGREIRLSPASTTMQLWRKN